MENSKTKENPAITKHQIMEIWIGNILRIGVSLSAFLVVLGGMSYLFHQGSVVPQYSLFKGEPARLKGFISVLHTALILRSRSIIQLGLLLLIATPVARVVFSVFVFARQKDWLYTWITLIVLCLLILSLTVGYGP